MAVKPILRCPREHCSGNLSREYEPYSRSWEYVCSLCTRRVDAPDSEQDGSEPIAVQMQMRVLLA